MRIQKSECGIKKKNNTMVILAPDSWLLYSPAFLSPLRAWVLLRKNCRPGIKGIYKNNTLGYLAC